MEQNKKNKTKSHLIVSIFTGILGLIISTFSHLFITPIITEQVGVDACGFVTLAKNFVSYANIILIAVNSLAARFITISRNNGEKLRFQEYYSTVFLSNLYIGGSLFLASVFFVIKLDNFLNIPLEILCDVKVLFALTFINFLFTTLSSTFKLTGLVADRMDLVNIITDVGYVVDVIILIICFYVLTPKVQYVMLATLISTLVMFIMYYVIKKIYLPDARVRQRNFSKSAFRDLVKNGIWNSINNIGNALNSGLDLLITNLMLSALSMGQISIAKTITTLVNNIYVTIASSFYPSYLSIYSKGDIDELLRRMKEASKICGLITSVIFAGFWIVGKEFLYLWIPSQDNELIYRLTLIALVPCLVEAPVYPLYYTYVLKLKQKVPCFITIIGGIVNVIGMYFLLKYTNIGPYAVLLTTAIIMGFINLVSNPIYISRCLEIKISRFYPKLILNLMITGITIAIFEAFNLVLFEAHTWIQLILKIVIYGMIGVLIQSLILFHDKIRLL